MRLNFDSLETDRVEDWKEDHPELFEEYKEDLFTLVLASSADQLEHLADRLEEMVEGIRDELNDVDRSFENSNPDNESEDDASQTEMLLDDLDQRLFELDEEYRPDTLEKCDSDHDGSTNHFTEDSLIKTGLLRLERLVEVVEIIEKQKVVLDGLARLSEEEDEK